MAGLLIAASVPTGPASALEFSDGDWRLELSGGPALDQGIRDRNGDALITGYLDYEIPATAHTSLTLRTMPLFVYTQNDEQEDWWRKVFHHSDSDYENTVFGGGAGLAGRVYAKSSTYEGFFAEAQILALGHLGRIDGDDSNFDFLSGFGLGYRFNHHWDALLRIEHISNAGLGDPNSGVNALRVGAGYRF